MTDNESSQLFGESPLRVAHQLLCWANDRELASRVAEFQIRRHLAMKHPNVDVISFWAEALRRIATLGHFHVEIGRFRRAQFACIQQAMKGAML